MKLNPITIALACLLLVGRTNAAGSAKKLKTKRHDLCIGFDTLTPFAKALLLDCDDRRVVRFQHDIDDMRLAVTGTNLCLDDWGTDQEIRLNTCSASSGQRDQMWLPLSGRGGYAFYNLANDCILDDVDGIPAGQPPCLECEKQPTSLNKDNFRSSQIFVDLGRHFIE